MLLAACGGLAPDGEQHRMLASSGGSASGSGSGSMDLDACPHKHGGHHATNREHIELMVVAVIMLTVVVEVLTHKLDHYAEHSGEHIFQIVQRVYKELMLLGIISFSLFFEASFASRRRSRMRTNRLKRCPPTHRTTHPLQNDILLFSLSLINSPPEPPPLSQPRAPYHPHPHLLHLDRVHSRGDLHPLCRRRDRAPLDEVSEGISLMQYAALKMQVKERCRATCCARLHMQSHAARASCNSPAE